MFLLSVLWAQTSRVWSYLVVSSSRHPGEGLALWAELLRMAVSVLLSLGAASSLSYPLLLTLQDPAPLLPSPAGPSSPTPCRAYCMSFVAHAHRTGPVGELEGAARTLPSVPGTVAAQDGTSPGEAGGLARPCLKSVLTDWRSVVVVVLWTEHTWPFLIQGTCRITISVHHSGWSHKNGPGQ